MDANVLRHIIADTAFTLEEKLNHIQQLIETNRKQEQQKTVVLMAALKSIARYDKDVEECVDLANQAISIFKSMNKK